MMNAQRMLFLSAVMAIALFSCTKSDDSSDQTDGDWVKRNGFPIAALSESVVFTIGDYAYIGTGYDIDKKRYNTFFRFDGINNSWAVVADIPGTARNSAVGFSIGAYGYVGTGTDGVARFKDFYKYDPAGDTWSSIDDFPGSARYDAIAFGISDTGYVGTGYDVQALKDVYKLNGTTDKWNTVADFGLSDKHYGAVAFVHDSKAYVCGGYSSTGLSIYFQYYNPSDGLWHDLANISNSLDDSFDDDYGTIPRTNGVAFVINDKGFITTGNSGSVLTTTWQYTFSTDRWKVKTPFESYAREGAVGFSVAGNTHGFVGLGRSGTTPYDNFMEFKPTTTQVDNN